MLDQWKQEKRKNRQHLWVVNECSMCEKTFRTKPGSADRGRRLKTWSTVERKQKSIIRDVPSVFTVLPEFTPPPHFLVKDFGFHFVCEKWIDSQHVVLERAWRDGDSMNFCHVRRPSPPRTPCGAPSTVPHTPGSRESSKAWRGRACSSSSSARSAGEAVALQPAARG